MVLGVTRRVHRHQDVSRTHLDLLPVVEHMQTLGGCWVETAVEGVEERPVDAGRRIDEARWVSQMPGSLLVDVDLRRRKGAGDIADPTGMVEVDVCDRD